MLSAAEGHKIESKLFCQFDSVIVRAKALRLNQGLGCKWQYFFIDCPLSGNLTMTDFNLIDTNSKTHSVSQPSIHLMNITRRSK
jgi:hypothetical protein